MMRKYQDKKNQTHIKLNTVQKFRYYKLFKICFIFALCTLLVVLFKVNLASEMHQPKLINVNSNVKVISLENYYGKNMHKSKGLRIVRAAQYENEYNKVNEISEKSNENMFRNSNSKDLEEVIKPEADPSTEIINFNSTNFTAEPAKYLAAAIKCQGYKDNCTLYCSNGSVSYIDYDLESLQTTCWNKDLNLVVTECEFNFGILQQSFFYGYFSLASLSINKCNLQSIQASAFQHYNVRNLQTLILVNNQISSLEAKTFDGLSNLWKFEFVQTPLATLFEGDRFLSPLANNLQEAVIQSSFNDSRLIDPSRFWQQLRMNNVTILDISNTNLQGVLNKDTFQAFVRLEYLMLYNCNLLSIKAEVFDFISSSFKYLDVRFNHLKTLDNQFLEKLATNSIELKLDLNDWECECDEQMLQYFTRHEAKLSKEILCKTPEKWHQFELVRVIEECRENESIGTTTTSSNSATSSTTLGCVEDLQPDDLGKLITTTCRPAVENTATDDDLRQTVSTTQQTIENSSEDGMQKPISNSTELNSILCYLDAHKLDVVHINITKPKANFTLFNNSSTSVSVIVQPTKDLNNFSIFYRNNYDGKYYTAHASISKLQSHTGNAEVFYIPALLPSVAYVYCLVAQSSSLISPYDCQSHTIELRTLSTKWLLQSDKVWSISVTCFAAILFLLLSSLIVYFLLRLHPQWLSNYKIFGENAKVLQSPSLTSEICNHQFPLSQTSSDYLSSLPAPPHKLNTNNTENMIYNSQHAMPIHNAPQLPAAPKMCAINCKLSSTVEDKTRRPLQQCSSNIIKLENMDSDPDYTVIDYYEVINI